MIATMKVKNLIHWSHQIQSPDHGLFYQSHECHSQPGKIFEIEILLDIAKITWSANLLLSLVASSNF